MEQQPNWKIKQFIKGAGVCTAFMLVGVLLGLAAFFFINGRYSKDTRDEAISVQAAEAIAEVPEEIIPEDTIDTSTNEYATSHNEDETEIKISSPLTDESIIVGDLYAPVDSVAVFRCYDPEAIGYTWEVYSLESLDWQEASVDDTTIGADELYREVSSFMVAATEEQDGMLIRCTVAYTDREPASYTGTLHILNRNIARITAEDVSDDVGSYLGAKEIPVTITYVNGDEETIIGLSGLYFIESLESSEYSTTISGNAVETITTVITAREYHMLRPESEEVKLRFPYDGSYLETVANVRGEDLSAPIISGLYISEFEVSNIDKPVPVTVSITAEDKGTPYPYLQYAFLPDGQEPTEDDWIMSSSFDMEIGQNGTWTAYCRDQSGNIATESRELVVVDNKAPVMSIRLAVPEDNWGVSNKIIVEAQDYQSVEFNFTCTATGESSGWTDQNEYEVTENNVWKVQARDAVGNMAEEEVTIRNIDRQMPVINNISVVEEEKYLEN